MRKIPATLITQHPDHANIPYWHDKAFITTQEESEEAYRSFSELHATEYKWDWEGKLVDESVLERLFSEYYSYFKDHPIGKDVFLTFRLPNPKIETEFRIGRAFMSISSAASLAKKLALHTPPLFEVILPMTETAEEMVAIQDAFVQMYSLKHDLYKFDRTLLENIEIIPLFEEVHIIMNVDQILKKYLALYKKSFHTKPVYMRPYIARSDPALNAGIVPTVLAIKVGLSKLNAMAREEQLPLYPMLGAAALPFRGGLTPYSVKSFAKEYAGIRTTTIQSAFRYDYPKEDVIKGIELLEKILPKGNAKDIPPDDERKIKQVIQFFETQYKQTIEQLAPLINHVASDLPKRRERVQHVGLFGYSRGVGKVKLPRAIGFTASLYSLGVPPEIIGTGRGLREAKILGLLPVIEKYYLNIKSDLLTAGRFVNRDVIEQKAKDSSVWNDVLEDIKGIEEYLGRSLTPHTDAEKAHFLLSGFIQKRIKAGLPVQEFIEETAKLRKSLG